MLLLELYETAGKKTKRHLGTLALAEERIDEATGLVSYTVMAGDRKLVATVQIQTDAHLPWKAVLIALQKLYGNVAPYFGPLRADGRCNAITNKGNRCQISAMGCGYYCAAHDSARRLGS